jgi:DNA polymerase III epsilon subunit-like protein
MQKDLLRFNDKQKYILFDLETENLSLASNNKPWQLGYIIGEGKETKEAVAQMIKWDPLNISEGAAKVTKFNKKKYNAEALDPLEVLTKLDSYIYDKEYKIIIHNGLGFDVYIHNNWRKTLGFKTDYSYINRVYDTNCLAKAIKTQSAPKENEKLILFQYKMNHFRKKGLKTNLTALGEEYGIDFDPETLHDAYNDCILNWQVWNKIIWQLDI